MRHFAWCCVVVGILVAVLVPLLANMALQTFAHSTDYTIWSTLADKVTWQPAGLRAAEYWEWWRWPAVLGGAGLAAFGVLLLAIRKPEKRDVAT
jgi:hypothetical protein